MYLILTSKLFRVYVEKIWIEQDLMSSDDLTESYMGTQFHCVFCLLL